MPRRKKSAIEDTESDQYAKASEHIRNLRSDQGYMSIGSHLDELRFRLIRSLIYVAVLTVIAWFAYKWVYSFVLGPLLPLIADAGETGKLQVKLIVNQLGDFFALKFKLVLVASLVFSLPFILLEVWRYVLPALEKKIRRGGFILIFAATLLFWGGVIFSRTYVWPVIVHFLVLEWIPPALSLPDSTQLIRPELYLTLNDYLSFFFLFHFVFGISFELPVVSFLLAAIGLLNRQNFFGNWRLVILLIAILSAVLTPADLFSMLALLIPLTILYFISGLLVLWVDHRRKRNEKTEPSL